MGVQKTFVEQGNEQTFASLSISLVDDKQENNSNKKKKERRAGSRFRVSTHNLEIAVEEQSLSPLIVRIQGFLLNARKYDVSMEST